MKSSLPFISVVSAVLILMQDCNFSKSSNTEPVPGLKTTGNGLSCEEIYLSINQDKIERNTFIYGESIRANFSNIQGFIKTGESVFPGLSMFITYETGDTIVKTGDLYINDTEGMDYSPLLLSAILTIVFPLQTNNDYVLTVNIWDKKGSGTFSATFPFSIIENDKINVVKNQASCTEVYLYSADSKQIITDQVIDSDEQVAIYFDEVAGFQEENGEYIFGSRSIAIDHAGDTVMDYTDMHNADYHRAASTNELEANIYALIFIYRREISNPVNCEITLYDKKSNASLTARTELTVNKKEDPF